MSARQDAGFWAQPEQDRPAQREWEQGRPTRGYEQDRPAPRGWGQEAYRPASQTQSTAGELTLASAARYLPSWAVKALRQAAPPLADNSLPEPEVLRAFWERVDHAIRSLHESFTSYER